MKRELDCDLKDGRLAEKGKAAAPSEPRAFQKDQSKFFRDVAPGDRHARLRAVGVAIRCETRAGAAEIADAMRWHADRFSEPLDDEKWIQRTAKSIERRFLRVSEILFKRFKIGSCK
jgi:hypothetical protein